MVSACVSAKNCFFVCYSQMGLIDRSPVGFQSQVFLGPIPRLGSSEDRQQMCSTNPLLFREKLRFGGSILIVWCCVGSGVYDKSMSQPSLPVLIQVICGQESLSFWNSLRGNCCVCSCTLVCPWEEGGLRASYVAFLVLLLR